MGALYAFSGESGNFSILSGENEVIIIDANLPFDSKKDGGVLKEIVFEITKEKGFSGLILLNFCGEREWTGERLFMILKNFSPSWIMLPTPSKKNKSAKRILDSIQKTEFENNRVFRKIPVAANRLFFYPSLEKLSRDFTFLPFSPFLTDKDDFSGEDLVLKITEKKSGRSILAIGNTAERRFKEIGNLYGKKLKSDILLFFADFSSSAPAEEMFDLISPEVALIIAEDGKTSFNLEAMSVYEKTFWFSTASGHSFSTIFNSNEIKTARIKKENFS